MSSDFDYIVCMPTSMGPARVKDATTALCSACGAEVWVAPSTLGLRLKAPYLCLTCAWVKSEIKKHRVQ